MRIRFAVQVQVRADEKGFWGCGKVSVFREEGQVVGNDLSKGKRDVMARGSDWGFLGEGGDVFMALQVKFGYISRVNAGACPGSREFAARTSAGTIRRLPYAME